MAMKKVWSELLRRVQWNTEFKPSSSSVTENTSMMEATCRGRGQEEGGEEEDRRRVEKKRTGGGWRRRGQEEGGVKEDRRRVE